MENPDEPREDFTSPISTSDTSHSFSQAEESLRESVDAASAVTESQQDGTAGSEGGRFVDPRPASKPEKHIIYKSMNFLPFTTRFEMLRQGSSMRLVDINPRQAVRIFDDRPPEFSHKKCRVLKYVAPPSDSSSSSESYSSDSSQSTCDSPRSDMNNNYTIPDTLDSPDVDHRLAFPISGTCVYDNKDKQISADVLEEDEEVDVLEVPPNQVSEAAEILLSLAQSKASESGNCSIPYKSTRGFQNKPDSSEGIKDSTFSVQSRRSAIDSTKNSTYEVLMKSSNVTSLNATTVNGSNEMNVYDVLSTEKGSWVTDMPRVIGQSVSAYKPLPIVSPDIESSGCSSNLARSAKATSYNGHQGNIYQPLGNFWKPHETVLFGKPYQGTAITKPDLVGGYQANLGSKVLIRDNHCLSNNPSTNSTSIIASSTTYLMPQRSSSIHIPQQMNTHSTLGKTDQPHVSVIRIISPRISNKLRVSTSPASRTNNLQAKFNNEGLLCKNKPALADGTTDSEGEPDFDTFASTWHSLTVDVAGNSVHKCILCSKICTIYQAFKNHVQLHFRQRNKCTVCGKTFSRPWLLKGHMRTHTGERPYKCEHPGCFKAFADRSNLRSHTMIHKSKGKEYTCTSCDRAFAQKRYLQKHMAEVCRAGSSSQTADKEQHIATERLITGHHLADVDMKSSSSPCILGRNLQKFLPKSIRKDSC